ncbi:DgyrCDS14746 [Dimorphilus gyrociliatus]|uniref:DgyrCDS14746 n=1 Tax=Dimorphilus gyrociliatus TaxID=2664684 RepID=A0A7I8WEQ8_9ANNE|nr:DgyrCDS14746 [Dimorphilus gyrociliatus]
MNILIFQLITIFLLTIRNNDCAICDFFHQEDKQLATSTYVVIYNIDDRGVDYCKKLCYYLELCKSFYVDKQDNNKCYLSTDHAGLGGSQLPQVIGYDYYEKPDVCDTPQFGDTITYTSYPDQLGGFTYHTVFNTGEADCKKLCSMLSDCNTISIVTSNQICHIFKATFDELTDRRQSVGDTTFSKIGVTIEPSLDPGKECLFIFKPKSIK